MSSNFNKLLPVIHISVRHDIFYNFSSGVKNIENKKKSFFVVHFHKLFRQRPLMPFDSCSFSSNVTELSVAIILNLFWVVFHGILTQVSSDIYEGFTSDAIKLSPKK